MADLVAASVGFSGGGEWDTTKPDGTPRKQLDMSRLAALGWQARIPLEQGVRDTCGLLKDSVAPAGVPAGLATVEIRET
ncbi:hypothetical protein KBZ18_14145 [Synechococcus sp. Cruz-9H2]|uniref:hypothetical protein n=1 Tax=unclassified Synechococcus TaxID=2626047 RepID=UPI0028F3FF4B|nr:MULTISPECIES: hypothetical protein [unclassified Synechococcus]MCP9820625.1 hypothetical protein [Synechococcus sp. Cruz-9H2]MCP9844865.1 hypothetical protein [Synechococcus sp. Edmonson 11F2]MCP9856986.1 hypothetical protein [Synechococcus sp. Cruz-9C9]MCP9864273.1 hypothetical protein [Synechococcus sp. Cruz-7E5]MCP9871541.1 hypothetical protein [Synechococcus sp. Cruz-7B9]